MIIDRHNYEECFILYWDNELTVSQKQAVENFVKENTDLEHEFKLLGETRFTPDNNIRFEEKEFLVNDSFINVTNYEEQLLDYIDDEVTAEQRKEVEKFAGLYPAVQKELALLQRTKLQPEEEIVFPDKSTLYRREEKVRLISMTWFRVAVAAAILLIAGFATFKLVNTNDNGNTPPVAKIENSTNQPSGKKVDPSTSNPGDQIPKDDIVKGNEKSTKDQTTGKNSNKIPVDKNAGQKPSIAYQPENKNNLPEPKTDLIANNQNTPSNEIVPNLPDLKKTDRAQKTDLTYVNDPLAKKDVTNKPELALYIPEAEAKEKDGGGIKEFLRKTTRVFERRTKINTTTDDNKLLVGAFAVSLK